MDAVKGKDEWTYSDHCFTKIWNWDRTRDKNKGSQITLATTLSVDSETDHLLDVLPD